MLATRRAAIAALIGCFGDSWIFGALPGHCMDKNPALFASARRRYLPFASQWETASGSIALFTCSVIKIAPSMGRVPSVFPTLRGLCLALNSSAFVCTQLPYYTSIWQCEWRAIIEVVRTIRLQWSCSKGHCQSSRGVAVARSSFRSVRSKRCCFYRLARVHMHRKRSARHARAHAACDVTAQHSDVPTSGRSCKPHRKQNARANKSCICFRLDTTRSGSGQGCVESPRRVGVAMVITLQTRSNNAPRIAGFGFGDKLKRVSVESLDGVSRVSGRLRPVLAPRTRTAPPNQMKLYSSGRE